MFKLLLVEDERLERQAIRRIVEESGLEMEIVAEADNGEAAVKLAELHRPHAMLVDIRIPGVNGLELIRRVGSLVPDMEFVIVSAYDFVRYAREALGLGVREYLLKPVRREEVHRMLARLLEVQQARIRRAQEEGWLIRAQEDFAFRAKEKRSAGRAGEGEEGYSSAVALAMEYIVENYARDISLDEVAGMIPLNPFYFSRLFKRELGINFTDYLTEIRIDRAKQMLKTTMIPVAEIGRAVGYHDSNYFSRVFGNVVGMPPSSYRRRREGGE